MSISPPSDIVLDVARAADPTRFQEAAARLSQLSSSRAASAFAATTEPFSEVFDEVSATAPENEQSEWSPIIQLPFDAAGTMNRLETSRALTSRTASSGPFQDFEAMMLSSFVEAMLPQSAGGLFGAGSAGKMWQSMLAQHIAAEMADAGGIGIAAELQKAKAATDRGAGDPGDQA